MHIMDNAVATTPRCRVPVRRRDTDGVLVSRLVVPAPARRHSPSRLYPGLTPLPTGTSRAASQFQVVSRLPSPRSASTRRSNPLPHRPLASTASPDATHLLEFSSATLSQLPVGTPRLDPHSQRPGPVSAPRPLVTSSRPRPQLRPPPEPAAASTACPRPPLCNSRRRSSR